VNRGEWGEPEEPSLHVPGLAMDALPNTDGDATRRHRAGQHARVLAALIAERQRRETADELADRATQATDLDRHRQTRNHPASEDNVDGSGS